MKKKIIEVCVFNCRSAINAQIGGAARIELCDNMYEGGTTPSYGTIQMLKDTLSIDINVMIRPRGGDFLYDAMEFDVMKSDILKCKEIGVKGVVLGILKSDGRIDTIRTAQLFELAQPLDVTFHRAFDMTPDLFRSLEELVEIGIDRVLTSGGKNTVFEGLKTIHKLVKIAQNRIIIMPGSGINAENIAEISEMTGAHEFHMSGKKPIDSAMKFRKEDIWMGGIRSIDEYQLMVSDADTIQKTVQALRDLDF